MNRVLSTVSKNFKGVEIRPFEIHVDSRGELFEVLRSDERIFCGFGQAYVVKGFSGQNRGGHYHKNTVDYFVLLDGVCRLKLIDLRPGPSMGMMWTQRLDVMAERRFGIQIPAGVWHTLESGPNCGFLGLGIPSLPYDSDNPDTFKMTIDEVREFIDSKSIEDVSLDGPRHHTTPRFGRYDPSRSDR